MAAALENLMNPIPPRPAEAEVQKFDDVLKEQKVPLRSWRKKYRKMKIRFDRQMDESNKLWMDCHKLEALSKRLQEENDLLLESLLHLNETSPLPSYDLGDIHTDIVPSIESVPALEPDAPRTLSSLLNIPHAALTASNAASFPPELLGDDLPGYLTTAYEDEYIANLDTQLATPDATDDGYSPVTQLPKSRILPPEKEMLAANPMSVLSWLRRYHPETFIQEKEAAAENQKAHKPRSTGGAKRSSMATITSASAANANAGTPQPHKEEEEGDGGEEWMHAQEEKVAGGGRGKRTRDDEAYRPKGGSSRPAKRKRGAAAAAEGAEGEKPRGGKRARGSAAHAAATTPG